MFTDILLKFAGMLLDIDSVSILFFFKEPTFLERAPGGLPPIGGSPSRGARIFPKNILKRKYVILQSQKMKLNDSLCMFFSGWVRGRYYKRPAALIYHVIGYVPFFYRCLRHIFLPLVTWHFSTNNMSERRTRANVVDLQRRTRATLLIHQRIFAEFKIFKLSLEKWTYEILIGFLNCSTKTFLKICTFFLYDLLHKWVFLKENGHFHHKKPLTRNAFSLKEMVIFFKIAPIIKNR